MASLDRLNYTISSIDDTADLIATLRGTLQNHIDEIRNSVYQKIGTQNQGDLFEKFRTSYEQVTDIVLDEAVMKINEYVGQVEGGKEILARAEQKIGAQF